MKKEYREAFTEVYEIFKLMPSELVEKIPEQFRNVIMEERAIDYIPQIEEPIEEVELKKETILLLGLIYRDFLCDPEEKARLQEIERNQLEKLKDEIFYDNSDIETKQNYNDLLKTINGSKKSEVNQIFEDNSLNDTKEASLTVQKKWYQRIFDLIKRLFKK